MSFTEKVKIYLTNLKIIKKILRLDKLEVVQYLMN